MVSGVGCGRARCPSGISIFSLSFPASSLPWTAGGGKLNPIEARELFSGGEDPEIADVDTRRDILKLQR
jgi:hypothetical protein